MAPLFAPYRVLNLYEDFEVYGFPSTHWTFANDIHWNELGNLLAAVHLYRELAAELPVAPLTNREIRRSVQPIIEFLTAGNLQYGRIPGRFQQRSWRPYVIVIWSWTRVLMRATLDAESSDAVRNASRELLRETSRSC